MSHSIGGFEDYLMQQIDVQRMNYWKAQASASFAWIAFNVAGAFFALTGPVASWAMKGDNFMVAVFGGMTVVFIVNAWMHGLMWAKCKRRVRMYDEMLSGASEEAA